MECNKDIALSVCHSINGYSLGRLDKEVQLCRYTEYYKLPTDAAISKRFEKPVDIKCDDCPFKEMR